MMLLVLSRIDSRDEIIFHETKLIKHNTVFHKFSQVSEFIRLIENAAIQRSFGRKIESAIHSLTPTLGKMAIERISKAT